MAGLESLDPGDDSEEGETPSLLSLGSLSRFCKETKKDDLHQSAPLQSRHTPILQKSPELFLSIWAEAVCVYLSMPRLPKVPLKVLQLY